ncbi:hypothetical protein N7462_002083 [Penicillium macrosclerotiorum]|uniref:uncharacterized protein n=1 Tax=Penicillium macrosclerotiorum TaxID=303699 RepID=UPI0025494872|nr:uncharacterized protein N7462_002083 [Penicillium macrosclerotiorum]KAJ5692660.1 hypothetical protein N7462_002083 [Penicillium macrosclerotiorum]
MSDSYTSSSYYYSSTTNNDGSAATTGHRYTTTSLTEPDGTTTIRTARQDLGEPAVIEEHRYDSTGQEQLALPGPEGSLAGGVRRITDLDDNSSSGSSTINAGSAYGGSTVQLADDYGEDQSSYDLGLTPLGSTIYDSSTGAFDQHFDYDTGSSSRHHRELRDMAGRRIHRDVDVDSSGLSSIAHRHSQYDNPSTGTKLQRDDDVDISELM